MASVALSKNQQKRLLASLSVVFSLVGYYYLSMPLWTLYQEKRTELDQAIAQVPPEKSRPLSLAQLKLKLEELKADFAKTRSSFPVAENVSTLLVELEQLATEKVAIGRFYPTKLDPVVFPKGRKEPETKVLQQRIEIASDGDFGLLHRLLAEVEKFRYPLGVHSIEMARLVKTPGSGGSGGGLSGVGLDGEPLSLTMQVSAYLLEKAPEDMSLLGDAFKEHYPAAQLEAGVVNPFKSLMPEPTPAPFTQVPEVPAVPDTPDLAPAAAPPVKDPLAGWRLEGILVGPGDIAVVRPHGGSSVSVRMGEEVEGWTVVSIRQDSVVLRNGDASRTLSLPTSLF